MDTGLTRASDSQGDRQRDKRLLRECGPGRGVGKPGA